MKVVIVIEDVNDGVNATINNKDNGVEGNGAKNLSALVGKTMSILNTPLASTLTNVIIALDNAVTEVEAKRAEAAANED